MSMILSICTSYVDIDTMITTIPVTLNKQKSIQANGPGIQLELIYNKQIKPNRMPLPRCNKMRPSNKMDVDEWIDGM